MTTAAALALVVMTTSSLVANDRYGLRRRSESVGNVTNLISMTTIDFDKSESGELIRCTLLEDYSGFVCDDCWHSGEHMGRVLNKLSRSLHGQDYCSSPDGSPTTR